MRLKTLFVAAAALALPAGAHAQLDTSFGSAVDEVRQNQAKSDSKAKADAQAEAGAIVDANVADVVAGATVYDNDGGEVGTIESVDAQGAVLSTGTVKARVPVASFGKNGKGLVIAMTRAEFEAAVRAQAS